MDLSVIAPFFGGGMAGVLATAGYVTRRRRKPSLSLELDPNLAGTGPTLKKVANRDCAYVRLLVRNAARRETAQGVYVELEDIKVLTGETPKDLLGLRGMWLAWGDQELTNPQADRTEASVGPGAARPVDLVHLNAIAPGQVIIDVRPQPTGKPKPNRLREATVSLTLALHGETRGPKRYEVQVAHDGRPWAGWSEDARAHLSLEGPRPLQGRS
jgi:hypothetical protein